MNTCVYCGVEIFHAFIRIEEDNPNSAMKDVGWLDEDLEGQCYKGGEDHEPEVKGENR